jgi:putative lipoic acid-binding regulatory protein
MNSEDFYIKLKSTLEETTTFPTTYMFKFIVPFIPDKIKQVEDLFNHLGAVIEIRTSKNGNYASVSIQVRMENPEQIIQKYKEAGQVEGIVSL